MDREASPDKIVFSGRMSTFGGPKDTGVAPDEGLALLDPKQVDRFPELFLAEQPSGTTGLARRLNTDAHYIACRWDYSKTPRRYLLETKVEVINPRTGAKLDAQPVDWGPDPATGRVADLSDGLAKALGLETDDICSVVVEAEVIPKQSDTSLAQIPIGTWQVLTEEALEIDGIDVVAPVGDFTKLHGELNRRSHSALCLSGGGIRSGSFALGFMQSLAGNPEPGLRSYLGQFHFLSTVSGGGYIGGWFSAWLTRSRNARNKRTAGAVLSQLADQSAINNEIPALENLRINSNYLTPKVGAMSADAWADVAMYLRNLILNWFVIVPIFVLLILVAKAVTLLPAHFGPLPLASHEVELLVSAAVLLSIVFLSYQIGGRPTQGIANRSQSYFLACDLLPAVVASFCLCCIFARADLISDIRSLLPAAMSRLSPTVLAYGSGGVLGACVYLLSWFAAGVWRSRHPSMDRGEGKVRDSTARDASDALGWSVAGLLFGFAVVCGLRLLDLVTEDAAVRIAILIFAGPGWVLLSHLTAEMIFVGLTSYEGSSDDDREWLARSAGWYGIAAVGWTVFFGLLFLGTYLSDDFSKVVARWLAPIGGLSGMVSLLLGKTPWTSTKSNDRKKDNSSWSLDAILNVSVPLFAGVLVVFASAVVDRAIFGKPFWPTADVDLVTWLAATASVLVLVGIAPYFVNINRFSLHALYRNRIIRAFLGASRAPDRPLRNLFTDFDDFDNPRMHELWQKEELPTGENWRPLHIVNMALNIVSSQNLAWQERKAESFIVSPLHSGSGSKAFDGPGAYQRSEQYGDPNGISLGTAVAISGAAASSQMGYHSSPALAFLMSLFNVRLGWWLANPGQAGSGRYRAEGPLFALRPLFSEMFGLTTDNRPYVYLSDGGHFENLALYEMVRRRCRYIVVSDAGCDPDFSFEDLGNALRKIKIDLRVDVEFFDRQRLRMRPKQDHAEVPPSNLAQQYFCLGIIKYVEADGGESKNGILLYIKPGLRGDEPPDIASYAMAHPTFPHETTSDQWFSESQFESYRHLGFCVGNSIVECAKLTDAASPTLPDLLRALVKNETDIEAKYGSSL